MALGYSCYSAANEKTLNKCVQNFRERTFNPLTSGGGHRAVEVKKGLWYTESFHTPLLPAF